MVDSAGDTDAGESLLHRILDASPDSLLLIGRNLEFRYVSPAFRTAMGYEDFALSGQPGFDIIHPEDLPSVAATLNRVFTEGDRQSIHTVRFRTRHASGDWQYVEAHLRAFFDEAGERDGAVVTLRNVSERIEAERAREANEFLALTQASMLTGVAVVGDSSVVIETNPAFCAIFGYEPGEIIGSHIRELVPERTREHIESLITGLLSGGNDRSWSPTRETRGLRKDGEELVLTVSANRFLRGDKTPFVVIEAVDITERRRAEGALRELDDLYRSAIENAADAITVLQDGRVVYRNRAAVALLGGAERASRADDAPASFLDRIAPEDRERIRERYTRRTEGEPVAGPVEFTMVAETGERVRVEAKASDITWRGRPATLAVYRDVTDSHAAREALTQSEERYRATFDNAAIGIADVSLSGRWLRANRRLKEITGYDPNDGVTFHEATHPDDRAREWDLAERVYRGEIDYSTMEKRFVRPDGSVAWANVTTSLVRSDEGKPQYFVSIVEDVSERRTVQEELARQTELLAAVVNSAPILVFALDREGVFTLSEGRALKSLGREPGEAVGTSVFDLYEGVPGVVEAVRSALGGRPSTFTGKLGEAWFEAHYVPVIGAAGEVTGVVGAALDTTERERLEEQLREAQKLESLGRLAGGIAHDFNNLLTAILGYSEVLEASLDGNEEAKLDLAEIKDAAERAAGLTAQLLAFARRQVTEPQIIDLNDIIRRTTRLMQRVIREDIDLVTRTEEGLGVVLIDPNQVEQVLLNLVVNARDAMVGPGRITIWTENLRLTEADRRLAVELPPGDYVVMTVDDTGPGVPPEIADQIFDPFFTTKPVGKGTGLGLAMCHGIIAQAGGAIAVESEPGRGARFHVVLPRSRAAVEEPAAPGEQPVAGERVEHVLLVEDEPQVRAIAARVLRQMGCTVQEAANGEEAFALVETGARCFGLLVTDMVMPNISGRMVAERVESQCPDIAILFMSGYTEEIAAITAAAEPRKAFIAKPFTPAGLKTAVSELLAARKGPARGA